MNGTMTVRASNGRTQDTLLEETRVLTTNEANATARAKAAVRIVVSRNYQSLHVEVGAEIPVPPSIEHIEKGQHSLLDLCEKVLKDKEHWIEETVRSLL